ncbi:uncharacterized protein LOC129733001 [Wyeomyia smithii]|uniref:uncharacterized protein LOC129733001 n=1 Tax=Wyeomyia smithii TaxID=174621 RepID=UPI002467C339|nr:uncharacterized protein LOC129733001 [Wyeomyia smithii]
MAFLREYDELGHMKLTNTVKDEDPHSVFYLTHHYVLKPSSSTTRLRVVFDGSAETSTADVPKMYRQVAVHQTDTRYQKIITRCDSNHPLQTYDLQTVTYGLAWSPFLATMALLQLANDEEQQFPLAAAAVKKCFFIDDVLTAANTLAETIELKNQIIVLLERGCFSMHKFCSNSDALLKDVPEFMQEGIMHIQDPAVNAVIKTLGVAWRPQEDCFTFIVAENSCVEGSLLSKRMILSEIAKIFDPLGLVGQVVTAAKLIMRELWTFNLGWDQPVPTELANLWTDFHKQSNHLNDLTIPRWILSERTYTVEIHGFADASDLAYGACLYSRLVKTDGSASLRLICSKSRILPRKKEGQKQITTPRAELLAAQLLSRLAVAQLNALDVKFDSVSARNSTINRAVQLEVHPFQVDPADLISRGVQPKNLLTNDLWWNGPPTLRYVDGHFKEPTSNPEEELPELRNVVLVTMQRYPRIQIFDRISRYSIIQRAMAYVVRFYDYVRSGRKSLTKGLPTAFEITRATSLIIRMVQYEAFELEINTLKAGKEFKFPTRNSNPFIDGDGILRVGGHLNNAAIPYQHKHQALLPEKHPLTITLIRYLHGMNLHIGQRGLLGIVRQEYWPMNAKSVIRKIFHQCVPCFRTKPTRASQLMENLPDYRVQPSPVFAHTGIDFAGPFKIRSNNKMRNAATLKGYVCLFVCMATRAIHLEAVSDLTTEGFMGALKRFVSRRGLVKKLYSDNVTNFEGASNEMSRLAALFREEQLQLKMNKFCGERAIEWTFIPPRSPHFGGIWEAGVESVKSHLKLVMAEQKLSFEQFSTVLAQIEAILNSRPLVPMSEDPNDIDVITPAHFLIAREFQAIQEPSYEEIPLGRLSQWQLVQELKQRFWRLWSEDYLHELQKRPKDVEVIEYQVGALVLIVDENTPPLQWQMARIIVLHPGNDGHTRVVSLRTKDGVTKRAVKKICLLPLNNDKDYQDH